MSARKRARARRGTSRHSRPKARNDSLLVGIIALAVAVMLLGGAVLFLKLRPVPLAPSLTQEQISEAQRAIREFPDDDAAHTALGVAYLTAQRPDDARSEFLRALELNDKNWRASLELALLVEDEDPDRAVELLEMTTKNVPPEGRAVYFFNYGRLLFEQGRLAAAKKALVTSVAAGAAFYDSRLALGRAYAALGQKDAAEQEYRRALLLNPGDEEVKEAIKSLKGGTPDSEEAAG